MTQAEELGYYKSAYETLLECMPAAYIIYNAETGRLNRISQGILDMFGCSEEDFREHYYNNFELMVLKQDRALVKQQLTDQLLYSESLEVNFRIKDLSGEIRYINFKGRRFHDMDLGEVVFAFLTDVSDNILTRQEIQRVNERLAIETRKYQLLQETTDDIPFHYVIDADTMMLTVKEDGIRKEKSISDFCLRKKMESYICEEDRDRFVQIFMNACGEAVKATTDVRLALPSEGGSYVWYRIYYASFPDQYGSVSRIMGTIKNIAGEKEEQEALRSMARMDAMTGLLNKTAIGNTVSEELARSDLNQVHALFIIDADNFKAVNDNLGHLYGDKVICSIARTIRSTFRDSDYIGRIGGDEFLVLMRGCTEEIAEQRAQDLNEAVRQTYEQNGVKVTISLSIGLAFYPRHATSYMGLYAQADTALYHAKEDGRNCYRIAGQPQVMKFEM